MGSGGCKLRDSLACTTIYDRLSVPGDYFKKALRLVMVSEANHLAAA
jgi:hypothetical protein